MIQYLVTSASIFTLLFKSKFNVILRHCVNAWALHDIPRYQLWLPFDNSNILFLTLYMWYTYLDIAIKIGDQSSIITLHLKAAKMKAVLSLSSMFRKSCFMAWGIWHHRLASRICRSRSNAQQANKMWLGPSNNRSLHNSQTFDLKKTLHSFWLFSHQ